MWKMLLHPHSNQNPMMMLYVFSFMKKCNNCTRVDLILHNFQLLIIRILLDFSLTVKATTLIFISGCGSAISSAMEGKSGFIYNLVKS